uniref:Endonuclease/exonuclease/phosphatase domain-containing protein n=2 Tax=Trichogramma kaykai TaxID=54128 RepID=A0ABD2X7Q8_9HYME
MQLEPNRTETLIQNSRNLLRNYSIQKIKLVQINAYSIKERLTFLADFMKEHSIDVLSIPETWCTPDIPDDSYRIPGYKFARADRGLKKSNNEKNTNKGNKPSKPDEYMYGGGVGLYIRDTIKWREIRKSAIKNMNETEYIIVELHGLNGDRVLVASAYRRPKGHCLADSFEVLSDVSESYSDVVIMGDLNSDLSATDVNEEGRDLEKLLERNSYHPVPFGPTHHQARLRSDPITGQ